MNNGESTIDEVLSAINEFAGKNEKHLEKIDEHLGKHDQEFVELKRRLGNMEKRLGHLENHMVTKQFLMDKLADKKGEAVLLARKLDAKYKKAIELLHNDKIFSEEQRKEILTMEPFAELIN